MDEPIAARRREITFRELNPASLFALAVLVPVLSVISIWVWRERELIHPHLVFDLVLWTLLVGAVELLPAPAWRGIHVSLGFPILTAVAITYPPGWAAAVALVGSTDPAEFRHETTLLKAIFNRCQVALAVFFSSATFHFFSSVGDRAGLVIAAALVASLVDYVTNFGIVVFATSLMYRTSVLRLARTLPRLSEFLVSYAGLAIVGVV